MSLPFQPITSDPLSPVAPPAENLRALGRSVSLDRLRRLLRVRRVLLFSLLLALGLLGLGRGEISALYRRWHFNNTVLLGQRWLEAGRLERAADSVRQALALDANRPEPWRLASELAWRRAQKGKALDYAAKAARASGNRMEYVLAWANLGLAAGDLTEAGRALANLPPGTLAKSAPALRLSAQLAGRRGDYSTARDRLSAVLALDLAARSSELLSDQAQQGMVLLKTGIEADRRQGLDLLAQCAHNKGPIGRFALGILLVDSVTTSNASETLKWAQALLDHPFCTLDDAKTCLRAAAPANDADFAILAASVKSKLATSQLRSAELLGWLSQIGRTKEALEWARAVNSADVTDAPLFVAVAETFRQASQWRDLESWTGLSEWVSGVRLLQLSYRWMALSNLGETRAAEAEVVLAQLKGVAPAAKSEAMLAAQLFYSWGQSDRSVDLLWLISDDPQLNLRAVGMLIRHYQMKRDSAGLYRAFQAWCHQHPDDRTAAASLALFGSLSGAGDLAKFEHMAASSSESDPRNEYFRCCHAVVLAIEGRGAQALASLAPISERWKTSPSIAFAYGLALAAADRKAEARTVLSSLDLKAMTLEHAARCAALLR